MSATSFCATTKRFSRQAASHWICCTDFLARSLRRRAGIAGVYRPLSGTPRLNFCLCRLESLLCGNVLSQRFCTAVILLAQQDSLLPTSLTRDVSTRHLLYLGAGDFHSHDARRCLHPQPGRPVWLPGRGGKEEHYARNAGGTYQEFQPDSRRRSGASGYA